MFRLIRVRLALSYAGIALLVTLSLGAVLLVRLRDYYAGMERDYLTSNAKAISVMAAPMLSNQYPPELQDAQVSNLAFLSQTRVRIMDENKRVLADSGPWQSPKIGLGIMRTTKVEISAGGAATDVPSSVIVIQKDTIGSGSLSGSVSSAPEINNGLPKISVQARGQPDVLFFNAAIPVENGVYGLYLSKSAVRPIARSDQIVEAPILEPSGTPVGFVELSESPAYGREIVQSVAYGLAVAGGLAILLAIGVGWLTSRRFTAPLLNLTQATRQMSGGDLAVRVGEAERTDEFGILGKSFNQMASWIEETIQTLRRFLADAAHELQTPLTALRTNLELAKNEENHAERENYINQALAQIERLQHMIRNLLSLSHLESATGADAFQPVDLTELVRQVCEPFAARAEQAGQSLELDLSDRASWVKGSPENLSSASSNLLDNALKFTPTGGTVTIHVGETAGSVFLSVSDTGIGILPEEMNMLFNRFHRGRNASAYPGSGLGLAIVRAIAHAHGGSVQAVNNPQGGASFTLYLPAPPF